MHVIVIFIVIAMLIIATIVLLANRFDHYAECIHLMVHVSNIRFYMNVMHAIVRLISYDNYRRKKELFVPELYY